MKIKFQYIAFITAIAGIQTVVAQKKDENIGTEVVNVVKPYTPTVSDAFKVKETPVIEDDENTQKKNIEYNIFSYPVASTFSPEKGRAASVEREPKEKLFSNYATLGVGNYGTVNAELFVTQELENSQYVGGMLRHLSSQGDINDVWLDNNYANTSIDLTYGSRQKEFNWNLDAGYQNQVYNWYGLPQDFLLELTPDLNTGEYIADIDPKQTYNTAYVGGRVGVEDSFFHEASLQYKRFWDGYDSAENRFFVTPSFDVDVMDEKIKVDVVADYVGGTFDNTYVSQSAFLLGEENKYSNFNLGIQPSLLYNADDFAVQLGVGLFYSMQKQNDNSDNKIYVYPQVKASYKVVNDLMIAYAGAEGTLQQNSYADFVGQNPFVAPSLYITPTDQKYDVYVGLKGKLASTVAYNIRGSYKNEDNRAMFLHNSFLLIDPAPNFGNANSFGVVYDNLKTVSFFGELKADFSDKVTGGINAEFNSYTTDVEAEAWNLPQIKVGANLEVDITEKWYAGTNVFFVGERKGLNPTTDSLPPDDILIRQQTVTLDSYFDVNAHVGYKYNERLSGFVRLNNILGQNYDRWVNYQVQGFQFMVGASYKFNF
ncbi:TonB-dependent receptor [Flavobacterium rhizosphaerae]|uniref:TonB-dependent receptor n=1 Tax=Flavobacterium rhizosphaerae TaxID=3163298 RepID=A0ABW8Z2I4_9FLAO